MAKTLDYDFTDPQFDGTTGIEAQTGPTLTVTRAADATVMDYFNVLKTAGDNEPRFTGGRRVENEKLQSQTLEAAGWSDYQSARTDNDAVAPDGTTTATRIVDDGLGGTGTVRVQYNHNYTSVSKSWTTSCHFKAAGNDWVLLEVSVLGGLQVKAYFDLTNGAIGATLGTGNDAQGIIDEGNGWYRCWISYTGDSSDVYAAQQIYVADGNNDTTVARDGSSDILAWGMQVENVSGQDDPAPSEYIATTTAAKAQWYATKRRTNLLLQSNDFETTPWSAPVRCTATSGQSDPDGGTDAWSLSEDGSNNDHRFTAGTGVTYAQNSTYTLSAYLKASNRTWAQLKTRTPAGATVSVNYDLTGDGSVGSELGNDSASIAAVGGGWYRCSTTFSTGIGASTYFLYVLPAEADNDVSFQGLSQESILVYGIQIERGDTATAYIATTDAVASSDFDTAITPTGLLIEEARTNVCEYSQDFNTGWVAANTTVTVDQATAPDGTLTADLITHTSTTANIQDTSISVTADVPYCASIYVKEAVKGAGDNWIRLNYRDQVATNGVEHWFNLTTGAEGTPAVEGTGTTLGASGFDDVGNGWYRVFVVGTLASGISNGKFQLSLVDADGDHTEVTDASVYLWGAQLEAGAFPTSYIPNPSTGTTTRAADDNIHVVNDAGLAALLNDDEGTLYLEYSTPILTSQNLLGIGSADSIADMQGFYQAADAMAFRGRDGAVDQYAISQSSVVAVDTTVRAVGAYATNDSALYVDGVAGTPDTVCSMPSGLDSIHVGTRGYTTNARQVHIARIVYYDERLDDATLEDYSLNGIPVPVVATGMEVGDDDWFRRRRMMRRHRRLYARR